MDPENSSNLELPFHEYTYIAAGGGVPGDRGQDKGRVQTRWQSPAAPEPALCIYICMYTNAHIYIYTYIYMNIYINIYI